VLNQAAGVTKITHSYLSLPAGRTPATSPRTRSGRLADGRVDVSAYPEVGMVRLVVQDSGRGSARDAE